MAAQMERVRLWERPSHPPLCVAAEGERQTQLSLWPGGCWFRRGCSLQEGRGGIQLVSSSVGAGTELSDQS